MSLLPIIHPYINRYSKNFKTLNVVNDSAILAQNYHSLNVSALNIEKYSPFISLIIHNRSSSGIRIYFTTLDYIYVGGGQTGSISKIFRTFKIFNAGYNDIPATFIDMAISNYSEV